MLSPLWHCETHTWLLVRYGDSKSVSDASRWQLVNATLNLGSIWGQTGVLQTGIEILIVEAWCIIQKRLSLFSKLKTLPNSCPSYVSLYINFKSYTHSLYEHLFCKHHGELEKILIQGIPCSIMSSWRAQHCQIPLLSVPPPTHCLNPGRKKRGGGRDGGVFPTYWHTQRIRKPSFSFLLLLLLLLLTWHLLRVEEDSATPA